MDTFKFPPPRGKIIIHHARFNEKDKNTQTPPAVATPTPSPSSSSSSSRPADLLMRSIFDHPINKKMELFIPTVHRSNSSAATTSASTQPTEMVQQFVKSLPSSSPSPFYYDVTLPLTSLLSEAFLVDYLLPHTVYGLSIGTPIDHANVLLLTHGQLRLYVDTDTYESLGIDSPHAHSSFKVCSDRGEKTATRERLITIDLMEFARKLQLRKKQTPPSTTASTASQTDGTKSSSSLDRRLERLRWALGRCAPVEMRLAILNSAGECVPLSSEITYHKLERKELRYTIHSFIQSPSTGDDESGNSSTDFRLPDSSEWSTLLPPFDIVEQIESIKRQAKKRKKSTTTSSTTSLGPSSPSPSSVPSSVSSNAASPSVTLSIEHVSSSTSTGGSVFPSLASSRISAQDIWNDVVTYLGLVHGRMER